MHSNVTLSWFDQSKNLACAIDQFGLGNAILEFHPNQETYIFVRHMTDEEVSDMLALRHPIFSVLDSSIVFPK